MALTINLVDYGPLYNAFGAQRNAAVLATTQKEIAAGQLGFKAQQQGFAADVLSYRAGLERKQAQQVAEITQAIADIGKTIYSTMNDTALERTKVAAINLETEYSKRIAQGIYTGQISFDSEGKLQIPDELEAWYKEEAGKISKGLEGFPEVQAWASGQTAAIQQSGEIHALNVASQAATAQRAAAQKDTLQMALNKAVASGNLAPVDAALEGFTNMSREEKATLRSLAVQDFDFRTREGGIRNLVAVEGYEAGATAVEGWRKSGEVTSEQADSLLTTAANQGKVQGVVFAQQSQAAYQKMIDAGVDAEAAVKIVVKGIPEAYRSQTEELLRAAKETAETRADNAGDEMMQDYYGKNRDNPAGLRAFLDLPANGFSKAMKRETYMYWDAKIDSKLKGPPEPETPPQFLNEMRSVISDNWKYPTTDEKKKAIQQIARRQDAQGNFPVTADDYKDYLSMAADEKFIYPEHVKQLDVIHNWFDALRQKDKPNADKYTQQENQAIKQYTTHVKKGEQPLKDLEAFTSQLLHPTKAAVFFIDQADDMSGRARADQRRKQILTLTGWDPRAALTDEERISMRSFDLQRLRDQVGVGVDKGLDFVSANGTDGTDEQSNGLPMFYVKGIDRKNPDSACPVRFAINPKGRVDLQILDKTGNWLFTDYKFKTVVAEEKAAAEEQAGIEAVKRQKSVLGAAVEAAGKKGPMTVADINEVARAKRLLPSEVATEAAYQAAGGTAVQFQMMVDFLFGKKKVSAAQVAKAAKDIGISEAQLYAYALQAGVMVTK